MDLKLDYEKAKEMCKKRFSENYYMSEFACKNCPLNCCNSMFYCLKSVLYDAKGKIDIIIKDRK